MTRTFRASVSIALAVLLCGAVAAPVHADRNKARTSVNRSKSVNVDSNRRTNVDVDRNRNINVDRDRNVDINRNRSVDIDRDVDIDIDRDRDIDIDVDRHGCCYYGSGWGAAAAVATTAAVTRAVVGTRVYTLPPNCRIVVANGITYQQCGTVYYQPQFVGTTTSYVVVNSPY